MYNVLANRKYIGKYVYNRVDKRNADGTRNSHRKKSENDIVRILGDIPRIVDEKYSLRFEKF